ncbi:hypothetical protein VNI00_011917 [Paramarasmius palmivorus]|uniref:Uncharacterized protein n=1 Tax=Paramarasmius palmivorus TaxID=297713 RepID=A0AAW0CBZ2_9AGAR
MRLSLLYTYDALQLIGFALNAVIVITAFISTKVRRTTVWYSFMSAWVLWCISYSLLLGYQLEGSPPFSLCLFQAGTIYAAPPCNALLTLGILAQLYISLSATIKQRRPPSWINATILAVPIVVYLSVFVGVMALGLSDRDRVVRDTSRMYCNLSGGIASSISAALVGLASLAMLILEGRVYQLKVCRPS